jgi:hypothetical protein
MKVHHVLADGPAAMAAFGALLDQTAKAPDTEVTRGCRHRSRPRLSCCVTTCDGAVKTWVVGGLALSLGQDAAPSTAGLCRVAEVLTDKPAHGRASTTQ